MNCIFCNIVSNQSPSWKIYEDQDICAFFDYFPASKGHVLIIPRKHYVNIFDTPEDVLKKIIVLAKKIAVFYKEKLGIEHLNLLNSNGKEANQVVGHYHLHIIPRKAEDNIQIKWLAKEELRAEFDLLKDFIVNEMD